MPRRPGPGPDPFQSTHFVNGEQTLAAPAAPKGKKSAVSGKKSTQDTSYKKPEAEIIGVRG